MHNTPTSRSEKEPRKPYSNTDEGNNDLDDGDLPPRRSYKDDEDDYQQPPSTYSRNNYR